MHRSARVVIRPRRQVAERCYGILRSAGDIRAALIEMNRYRRRRGDRAVFGFPELCRELTGVDVGELARHPAEDVLHRYSTECFEVAPRKKAGHDARFPRRKRALYPVRFRHGSFTIAGRRVRLASYSAARVVVAWAVANRIGTLVVGDPRGINAVAAGARQNLRNANWRRLQARRALHNAAEVLGIEVRPVDERGTSSTCPSCARKVPKPKGRVFVCNACGYRGHRDLVGARNIAAIGGGMTTEPSVVTHRRVGTVPARRDRRRHLMDLHRSGPAPGRPEVVYRPPGSRSRGTRPGAGSTAPGEGRAA